MIAADTQVGTYPASVEVDGPPGPQDKLVPFLIRPFTGIELVLLAFVRNIVAYVHVLIIWFTVLTTEKVPEGSYKYVTQTMGFTLRVQAWIYGMTDVKPGSSMDDDPSASIRTHFTYTEKIPRLRILLNPVWTIVLYICFIPGLIMGVIGIYVGYFTVLFTGAYNPWAFEKVKRLLEWGIPLGFFGALLTDVQPEIVYM